MATKYRRPGRRPLGKVTIQLRVRPKTKDELWRLAEQEQITVSDYCEAILIRYFESLPAAHGYAKQTG